MLKFSFLSIIKNKRRVRSSEKIEIFIIYETKFIIDMMILVCLKHIIDIERKKTLEKRAIREKLLKYR